MTLDGPWLGVQRLSLTADAEAVLELAAASGVTWLDVADVYGERAGDAERRLRPFASRFRICTKGGLVRDGRQWRPDGRAGHLVDAAERSRERLGVGALDLFLWHAPDPRTPIATSARALRRVLDRGIARAVGVSNTTVDQLRAVLAEVPVSAVQVEVSRTAHEAVRSGIVEQARSLGIPVLAHRPLGGRDRSARALGEPAVVEVARRHGAAPVTVVLAWLRDLGLVPVPGPTRAAQVAELVAPLRLSDEDRATLDAGTEAGRQLRRPRADRAPLPDGREVVLIAGTPGAGKTRRLALYPDHLRLNRDQRGGTLDDLLRPLDEALGAGARAIVLDNTYPTRARRNAVVELAWRHGVAVRCEWLDTPDGDAEHNVVLRILDTLGRLPSPDELPALNRQDPSILPPSALYGFRDRREPPSADEGFDRLELVPFVRAPSAGGAAVLGDESLLARPELLQGAALRGERLLIAGFAPGDEPERWRAEVSARAAAAGVEVVAEVCTHPPGPKGCWCRKPLPGLPVLLARRAGVALARTRMVATSAVDRTLAARLGLSVV